MAIANSDGSIILSTKVDTSGMEQGTKSLKSQAAKLASEYRKAGMSQSEAFKKAWSEIERTKASTDKATVSTKKFGQQSQTTGTQASAAIAKIGLGLKTLLTYFIGIQTVFAAIRFSGASAELATQTEASVQRLVDIYGSASDSVGNFIDQNSKALGLSKSVGASIASTYGNLLSVWADQATNAELTNALLNQTAVVASRTGRTTTDVAERIRSGLLGNTEAIEDLGINVNIKTIEITDTFKRIADGRSWEQLNAYEQAQVRTLAILEQSTDKYGTTVADTSATIRNRFNAAYQDFQNSWGNIVNTVLIPVLETLTQIFDIAAKGLNALSGRSGQILENAQIQEDTTNKTAENIEEQADAQKSLNKEMKKTLAGFDDIQILSSQTAENTTGGGGGDLGDLVLGGASPDGSTYEQEISSTLTAIMGVVGMALAALGCILLFTGHIGWGIGFLIAGAATLGVTVATLGDNTIAQETKDALSNALIIAGVVAILIGILLCMAQQWGIGIGLIIIGASSIVAPVALNWDGIKEQLQGSFGGWLALGGIIAIVLGILLCFTPFLPLGIGLIVLGAGALVAPIVANWDAIWDAITGAFNAVIDWVKTYGLLILGILLCLTGGLPFGFALILKWAKDNAEEIPLANKILEFVKSVWGAVQSFWNKYIAPVFTAKFWLDLAKKCGNGLIGGFEAAINGIISMFEKMINWIVDGLNKISFDVPDWVPLIGGQKFGFNIPRANFGRLSIPRLAQGTVVPPNREFMAILGDNTKEHEIVSPVSTMKQAFMEAMVEMGGTGQTTKEEHYYLGETELMSILYKLVRGGERLSGESLISGGLY